MKKICEHVRVPSTGVLNARMLARGMNSSKLAAHSHTHRPQFAHSVPEGSVWHVLCQLTLANQLKVAHVRFFLFVSTRVPIHQVERRDYQLYLKLV